MTLTPELIGEKLVPVDVIREMTRGSYEHLSLRLDDAVEENKKLFSGNSAAGAARIATFPNHVLVGTTDGRYFRAKFEDIGGDIRFGIPEKLDVKTFDRGAIKDFISEFTLGAVDAILNGRKDEAKQKILGLLKLSEDAKEIAIKTSPANAIIDIFKEDRAWRRIFREQKDAILEQIRNEISSIERLRAEAKFAALYDGTIPEEKFFEHRAETVEALSSMMERVNKIRTRCEAVYKPFAEDMKKIEKSQEEQAIISTFAEFTEDLVRDLGVIHGIAEKTKANEECVMCIGQVHDAIAEELIDYEIAGAFVERMATRFHEIR